MRFRKGGFNATFPAHSTTANCEITTKLEVFSCANKVRSRPYHTILAEMNFLRKPGRLLTCGPTPLPTAIISLFTEVQLHQFCLKTVKNAFKLLFLPNFRKCWGKWRNSHSRWYHLSRASHVIGSALWFIILDCTRKMSDKATNEKIILCTCQLNWHKLYALNIYETTRPNHIDDRAKLLIAATCVKVRYHCCNLFSVSPSNQDYENNNVSKVPTKWLSG